MLRAVSRAVLGREFELRALSGQFWLLVLFYADGIVDHPLGEAGGHPGGKAQLAWYERNHEILGFGHSPSEACAGILRRGHSARLRAIRRADANSNRMRLLFKDLDSNRVYFPDQLFVHPS